MKILLMFFLFCSAAQAEIVMVRVSSDQVKWKGPLPSGENDLRWKGDVDIYLTDDLSGGLVWFRTNHSKFKDISRVVAASPMHTDDEMYFSGEDVSLTLRGSFWNDPVTIKDLRTAELEWWVPEYNENYVSSLRIEGPTFQVLPGNIVPEPASILLLMLGIPAIVLLNKNR